MFSFHSLVLDKNNKNKKVECTIKLACKAIYEQICKESTTESRASVKIFISYVNGHSTTKNIGLHSEVYLYLPTRRDFVPLLTQIILYYCYGLLTLSFQDS